MNLKLPASLPTPSLLVDAIIFEANLQSAESLVQGTGKLLRPHVKTHRTPALALRQIGPAAVGVSCATVGEAEVMVAAGITDVLLANEIVETEKIERFVRLASRARVSVAVDDELQVRLLQEAAEAVSAILNILLDIDVGLGRCGLMRDDHIRQLASFVTQCNTLRLAGLMGYEGRLRGRDPDRTARIARAFERLRAVREMLLADGHAIEVVSGAGTSTLREALADPTLTEIQAGTYALMETDLADLDLPFRCAVAVAATIISRSGSRAVVNAGRKTLGCEYGLPEPLESGVSATSISEEHLVLMWPGEAPPLGTRVLLRPSQVRTTFNLHDRVWLIGRNGSLEEIAISARGGSQ